MEYTFALFTGDYIYDVADQIPKPDVTHGGRPRQYPDYIIVAFDCLAQGYGSSRRAAAELSAVRGVRWEEIRRIVADRFPDQPEMHLPEKPLTRECFNRRRKYLLNGFPDMHGAFEPIARIQALEQGYLDINDGGSINKPTLSRVITADGKAIAKPTKYGIGDTYELREIDEQTGEVTVTSKARRACPDAAVHITGDGRQIHGSKFMHVEVRGSDVHDRVILTVAHVPAEKGMKNSEVDITMDALNRILPKVPGALAVAADGMLRGVHINELITKHGILVISPSQAKSKKSGERVEHSGPLQEFVFTYADGTTSSVEIFHSGGALAIRVWDDMDNSYRLEPLQQINSEQRKNKDGTWRFYVRYLVPDPNGGESKVIRVPVTTDADDVARAFNRSQYIRQAPSGTDFYKKVYPRRSDSESLNRQIDDSLYRNRARSFGARGQLLNLLSHAILLNSVSAYRHRERQRKLASSQSPAA